MLHATDYVNMDLAAIDKNLAKSKSTDDFFTNKMQLVYFQFSSFPLQLHLF